MRTRLLACLMTVAVAGAGPATAPTVPTPPAAPASTPASRLATAKVLHAVDVADAGRRLSMAVDGKLTAATDEGDLTAVETLRAAKATVDKTGSLPAGTKGDDLRAAQQVRDAAVAQADAKLADAYRATIRDDVRGHDLDAAWATKAEFAASGLDRPAPAAAVAAPAVPAAARDDAATEPGLVGEVFTNEHFTQRLLTRIDPQIDFEWPRGKPPARGCPTPRYSIRWQGWITVPAGGMRAIGGDVDDGFRLRLDGVEVAARKTPGATLSTTTVAAGRHRLTFSYWNLAAEGVAKLVWTPPAGTSPQLVPASALSHDAAADPPKP